MPVTTPLAAIFGCAGTELSSDEIDLFRAANPLGLILFSRNCETPGQVTALTSVFRDIIGRQDAPVLIDQEGGRVTRLKPPHWRHPPAAWTFVELAETKGLDHALEAIRLNYRLIGVELRASGINVDCAPVLDLPTVDADPIIGDRALGRDVALIGHLSQAVCEGLLEAGVLPVIKHLPGHGRATVDSHQKLPQVDTSYAELLETDFEPFRRLAGQHLGMTAHVIFSHIDASGPATISGKVISEVIRDHIGFDGLLMSDDLSMKALSGGLEERASASLSAGCDVVLHCNGDMSEMKAVVSGALPLSDEATRRWQCAADRVHPMPAVDVPTDTTRLQELLET